MAETEKDLQEIEAQLDSSVPYYVPTLIRTIRTERQQHQQALASLQIRLAASDQMLRGADAALAAKDAELQQVTQERDTLIGQLAEQLAALLDPPDGAPHA